jgi:hypothetical protein
MTEISCIYSSSRNDEVLIVFLKYSNFITVHLYGCNKITLKFDVFVNIPMLYDLYVISLLLTENTKKLDTTDFNDRYYLNVTSLHNFNYYHRPYLPIDIGNKNLLLKQNPKRQTTSKKLRKFIKHLNFNFTDVDYRTILSSYITAAIVN